MHLLLPCPPHLKPHRLQVMNSLWIPPSDPNVRDLLSSKKSMMRTPLSYHWALNQSVTLPSSMSMTLIPSTNPSLLVDPIHAPRATTLQTFFPTIPMMILYLPWVTLNTSSLAKRCHPLSV